MPGKGGSTDPEVGGRTPARLAGVKVLSREMSKKMVQARLPFKRLNPVPKDEEGIPQGKKPNVDHKVSPLKLAPCDLPLEDMENGCEMETVLSLPKPKNGRGPLDNYLKKTSKPCHVSPDILIDLTEDSNGVDQNSSDNLMQTCSSTGTVLPGCGTLSNVTPTQSERLTIEPCSLKPTESVDLKCNVDTKNELLHSVDISETPVIDAAAMTSPVREDTDLSAAEACASSSSSSSPVSASSPEVPTESLLKDTDNFLSPTNIHKDKQPEEKRRKLLVEKEERDRAKEEVKVARERAKEEAKKKKDNEREQKAKEKREKKEKEDREKAEKLRLKEEKKKEKLEALEAKQEEKRKKEEEKRIKEEEKRTKAEKAEITRFLQKPKASHTPKTFAQSCGKFAPFEIKKNMAVAPLCRVEFEQDVSEQLDKLLKEQNSDVSFLLELKVRKPRKMGRTVMPHLMSVIDDEVQILEGADTSLHEKIILEKTVPEQRKFGKMKLLQFSENYRPAYWGTWNRSSSVICPRNPWAQDTKILDYELDSDEEWEEEEPGESLSHSEGDEDDDDPKEDDDEDDDGFFVPHGYLSEDEGGVSDEECRNPENQKVRQKLKAKEWDELQSKGKKINILKPLVIGCVWLGNTTTDFQLLQKYAACFLATAVNEEEVIQEINKSLEDKEILAHLLPLLHGNVNGSKTIIHEFQECYRRGLLWEDTSNLSVSESVSPNLKHQISNINIPSKARLKRIISENSVYEKRPDYRSCWYVHSDVLKSFQQDNLPVPCQWTYITQVNSFSKDDNVIPGAQIQGTPTSSKRKSAGSMPITKFMKKANEKGAINDTAATEVDGFQADTEEDADEDDEDCVILEVEKKKEEDPLSSSCKMEISFNEEMSSAPLKA